MRQNVERNEENPQERVIGTGDPEGPRNEKNPNALSLAPSIVDNVREKGGKSIGMWLDFSVFTFFSLCGRFFFGRCDAREMLVKRSIMTWLRRFAT